MAGRESRSSLLARATAAAAMAGEAVLAGEVLVAGLAAVAVLAVAAGEFWEAVAVWEAVDLADGAELEVPAAEPLEFDAASGFFSQLFELDFAWPPLVQPTATVSAGPINKTSIRQYRYGVCATAAPAGKSTGRVRDSSAESIWSQHRFCECQIALRIG